MNEKEDYVKLLLEMIKDSGQMYYFMGRLIGAMMVYNGNTDEEELVDNVREIIQMFEEHKQG
jgi:hypothetical protein